MSKPREFWVIKNEKHHTGLEWYDAFKQRQSWIRGTPKQQIHVIEKATIDKLLDEVYEMLDRWPRYDNEYKERPSYVAACDLMEKIKEFRSNE